MFEDGNINDVKSVILGTVTDEATFFTRQFMSTIVNFQGGAYNYADVDSLMPHFFGGNATSLALMHGAYPAGQFADPTQHTDAVFRDFLFLCPTQRTALALADHNVPTYLYQIEHINSNDFLTQPANPFNPYGSYGAYHSSELSLLFNTNINFAFSDDDKLFSSTLANYWSKMFASFNPNADLHRPFASGTSPAFAFWPRFERDTLAYMRLNSISAVGMALQETQCETWQRIAQYSPPL